MEQACEWQKLVTGHFVAENTTHWAATTSDQWDLMTMSQGYKVKSCHQLPTILRLRVFSKGRVLKNPHVLYA